MSKNETPTQHSQHERFDIRVIGNGFILSLLDSGRPGAPAAEVYHPCIEDVLDNLRRSSLLVVHREALRHRGGHLAVTSPLVLSLFTRSGRALARAIREVGA